jgi:uncharacterized protein
MRSFPILFLLIFLIFFLLIIFGAVKNINTVSPRRLKKTIRINYILLHVLMLFVFIYLYIYPNQPREATNYTVYLIYNFLLFTLLVFNLPNALSYFLYFLFSRTKPPVIPFTGLIISFGIAASMLFGIVAGSRQTQTVYHELSYPNLPAQFDGYKIFVFADAHLGGMLYGKRLLNKAITVVDKEKPDLILFVGDLVNNFAYETDGYETYFKQITKRGNSFSILGNHDYGDYSNWESEDEKQSNFNAILDTNRQLGFRLLKNEHVVIKKGGDSIFLAGVENWGHPPFPQYADLNTALQGVIPEAFTILLTHDPAHWESQVENKRDIELTFSGHTHGMQWGIKLAGIPFSLAWLSRKYWGGITRNGNSVLYVNTGFGTVGVPWRLDMPAEFSVITLKRGEIN